MAYVPVGEAQTYLPLVRSYFLVVVRKMDGPSNYYIHVRGDTHKRMKVSRDAMRSKLKVKKRRDV